MTIDNETRATPAKPVYAAAEIVDYGDVREVTQANGQGNGATDNFGGQAVYVS